MVHLLHAEMTRLRWRRAVVALVVLALVVPAVVLAGTLWETRPITDADRTQARAEMEAMAEQSVRDCIASPRGWGFRVKDLTPEEIATRCEERAGNVGEVEDWIYRPALTIRETREGVGLAVVTILALLAALIGTTFAGHDWATGSMGNQLLFESRRLRVWAAKFAAVVAATGVMALLGLGLFWGGIWVAAEMRDLAVGSNQWWWSVTAAARGVVLVAGAGGAAYALTMLLRSTVGALGVIIGAAIGSSVLLAVVLGATASRWMIGTNAFAFVLGRQEYYVDSEECWRTGQGCTQLLTGPQAAVYLAALVLVVVVGSMLSFRRRDVP